MRKSIILSLGLGLIFGAIGYATPLSPLKLTGFNRDVVVEVGSVGPFYTTAQSFDWGIIDPSDNNALYERGLVDRTIGLLPKGLPRNRTIDVPEIETAFQLERYNAPNSLRLGGGITFGRLTLAESNQVQYSLFAVLAASGNAFGARRDDLTIRFADGSTTRVSVKTDDWYSSSIDIALRGFGRVSLHAGGDDSSASNPRLYYTLIELSSLDQEKVVVGFDFSQSVPLANAFPNLMAISGLPARRGPVISPPRQSFIAEDMNTGPLAFTVMDDATPGSNLVFSAFSTNAALISTEDIIITGSETNFTIEIIPQPDAWGNTFIIIEAVDEDGNVGRAQFPLRVRSVNDAPSFMAGPNVMALDISGPKTLVGWASDIRAGPPDEAGQALTFQVLSDNETIFLDLPEITDDGTLDFTPLAGASGTAQISVSLMDDGGTTAGGINHSPEQTFTLTVVPSNRAPVASPGTFPGLEDQAVMGQVEASDEDEDTLSFVLVEGPLLGSLSFNTSDGAFMYVAPPNYNGSQSFAFQVDDGQALSEVAMVMLNIAAVNDAPSFSKGLDVSVNEDDPAQSLSDWATEIKAGPFKEADQTVSFSLTSDAPELFAQQPTVDVTGALSFTPAENQHGTATVSVVLRDDGGTANGGVDQSPALSFTLTIEPVNDPPTAQAQTVETAEDTPLTVQLTGEDVDLDTLDFIVTIQPRYGRLSGVGADVVYTPSKDFFGSDHFSFVANDRQLESEPAIVDIEVKSVNDPPVAMAKVGPLLDLGRAVVIPLILSPNNLTAEVVLDGSFSSDVENDGLQFAWIEDPSFLPFATGQLVETEFEVGDHWVTLMVDDGEDVGLDEVAFRVITPCEATEELIWQIETSGLDRNRKRPLIASLKTACASFDRGRITTGVNQLRAFQHKVRAQVVRMEPALADHLLGINERIMEALTP